MEDLSPSTIEQVMAAKNCTEPCAQGYLELADLIREMMEIKPLAWQALKHEALRWYERTMMGSEPSESPEPGAIHMVTHQAEWEALGEARKTRQVPTFFEGILRSIDAIRNPSEPEATPAVDDDWV